jgi:hypothetical protein
MKCTPQRRESHIRKKKGGTKNGPSWYFQSRQREDIVLGTQGARQTVIGHVSNQSTARGQHKQHWKRFVSSQAWFKQSCGPFGHHHCGVSGEEEEL